MGRLPSHPAIRSRRKLALFFDCDILHSRYGGLPMNSSRTAIVLRLLGVGWYVAICISAGAIGGFWLDSWLESSPVFTLVGTLLGVALAIIGMYRMLMAVLASSADRTDEESR